MNLVHIVGRKSHGKTMLLVELIAELTARGVRVGTIKHTGHFHELDTPETDSWRQRLAGAAPAAIVTGDLIGVYMPRQPESGYVQLLAPLFHNCDLVLVEGDLEGPGLKVEVWRQSVGTPSLATSRNDITAVVTDDPLSVQVPIWPRRDPGGVAAHILEIAAVFPEPGTVR